MNWHKVAKLVHEDEYMFAARWEQEGDIATNVHLLKDGVSWRAFVSRSPQVSKMRAAVIALMLMISSPVGLRPRMQPPLLGGLGHTENLEP